MPYFSVVIPLYNKENYISETLESVLSQTFADFEVIIVNDVSTDESLTVAQKFADGRIRIINHEKNKGLSASRNTGIENSQADLIAFLDADDLWEPKFLETIYNLVINHPEAALFATKYTEIYYTDIPIIPSFNAKTGILANFFKSNINKPVYCPSSLCVKKSVFNIIGLYKDVYFGEDVDFNIRAHLKYKMAYSEDSLVRYRMHSENQITRSSMEGKTRVDHDFYERENPGRSDLKKYLDFHRYTMAKRYKMGGHKDDYHILLKAIDLKNLNYKQRILLMLPAFALRLIKKIKEQLHKKGFNPTSY